MIATRVGVRTTDRNEIMEAVLKGVGTFQDLTHSIDSWETEGAGMQSTSVYLYFDRHDILIYVGITSRGLSRQREHNANKEWWPYVRRQEVEHYLDREEALSRERDLIAMMRPPFNKNHNPDRGAMRDAYLGLLESGTAAAPANKWLPMRVASHHEDLIILLTHMEHAAIAGTISTDTSRAIVDAGGYRTRSVEFSRIGSTLAIALRVRNAPRCARGRIKYRTLPEGREVKHMKLTYECDLPADEAGAA